jgi:hypothetical protein
MALHARSRLFLAMLMGPILLSFNCSSFAYKINYVQRWLSIVSTATSLCGPLTIRLKDGKSTRSRSFEELSWNSHLRARCRCLYHRVRLYITSALFLKLEHLIM